MLPRIESFHFPENLHSGQAVQVSCFVSEGDTPIKLFWSFNGVKMRPTDDVNFYKVGKKGSLLVIDPLTEQHSGNYTCTAQNRAGSVDFTARLSVNGIVKITTRKEKQNNSTRVTNMSSKMSARVVFFG